MSLPDEGYSRKMLYTLNSISTFLLFKFHPDFYVSTFIIPTLSITCIIPLEASWFGIITLAQFTVVTCMREKIILKSNRFVLWVL